ncbi:protein phosphatase 2C 54 [Hirschfeldia incana]|nr:protein phosphatase 2C 54 [Hirschfeldia incana]
MEKGITLPILARDCVSGDSKRVRMADPEPTVGVEGRPVKLPKMEDNVGGVGSTSEATQVPVDSVMTDEATNDLDGKTNAGHGVVSVMGRQRAMTTAVSTVVDEIPSYDIFGIFDGLRLAKFFEERLCGLVKEEVTACHGRGVAADWNKVMKSCFSESVGTVRASATKAVVTIVGKEEVILLCRGGARAVLYSQGGIALPLCDIHRHQSDVDQKLKIHKRTLIDDFIVLACEGLWDVVSDDDTYRLVKSCLHGELPDRCKSESSSTKAAVILAELAIARGSKENINVIIIDLRSSTVS